MKGMKIKVKEGSAIGMCIQSTSDIPPKRGKYAKFAYTTK